MRRGPTITGVPERGRALKTNPISVRVSDGDHDLIREAAGREDLGVAVFMRKAALKVAREVTGKDGKPKPVEIKS